MKVRLYGPQLGQGSFSRVTAGMKAGLEACGSLAGYVPIDTIDEETQYPGHDAEVGVYVGPPGGVTLLRGMGWHKHMLCLFPPNSTWVPKGTLRILEQYVTGLLAPSTWAKKTLEGHTSLPVFLWQHGVSEEFKELPDFTFVMRDQCDRGTFAVGHFASTPMQRKGTRELIQAWGTLVDQEALGKDPTLNLFVDGSKDDFAKVVCESTKHPESIRWIGRMSFTEAQASIAYQKHHLIVQPSRGEGFGLIPLESRACGVPTIMTACTGHLDHYHGAIITETGDMEPIDDGPNALAARLSVADLMAQIRFGIYEWRIHKTTALKEANRIQTDWSWPKVTNDFITVMTIIDAKGTVQ